MHPQFSVFLFHLINSNSCIRSTSGKSWGNAWINSSTLLPNNNWQLLVLKFCTDIKTFFCSENSCKLFFVLLTKLLFPECIDTCGCNLTKRDKNSRCTETKSCCSASTLLHIFTVWVIFFRPTSVCFLSVSFSSKYLVSVKLTQKYYQRGCGYLYEHTVPIIITAAGSANTDICSSPVYIKRLPASVCVALPGKNGLTGRRKLLSRVQNEHKTLWVP